MGSKLSRSYDDDGIGQLEVKIDDYVRKVIEFKGLCTTCEQDFNSKMIASVLNFGELTVIPMETNDSGLSAVLAGVADEETKNKIRSFIDEERKKRVKHEKDLTRAVIESMFENITQVYARDIFKLMAQELRLKNPWLKASNDVMVLREKLGRKWNHQANVALRAVSESKREFEKYYTAVVELSMYKDPASSGTEAKAIKSAPNWAQAILTLPRVYQLMESHYRPSYNEMRIAVDRLLLAEAAAS